MKAVLTLSCKICMSVGWFGEKLIAKLLSVNVHKVNIIAVFMITLSK